MYGDEHVDVDEFKRIFRMAYRGARAVLMMRRDPSIKQPTDGAELGQDLTMIAQLLTLEHFEERDLLVLAPILRGVWEADKEVGTEIGCWTG